MGNKKKLIANKLRTRRLAVASEKKRACQLAKAKANKPERKVSDLPVLKDYEKHIESIHAGWYDF
jgi:hypothetical protein